MMHSLSRRIFVNTLAGYSILLLSILGLAWFLLERLEESFFDSVAHAEVAYATHYLPPDKVHWIETSQLISVYIPHTQASHQPIPSVFLGLSVPFQGEASRLNTSYLVVIQPLNQGTFYFAQDLSLFEKNERLAVILVTACALMILGLSFFLATASARIAAKPLRHLVERIQTLNPHAANATEQAILDAGVYKETELQAICSALNGFLQRLQEALAREKNWMALASHEFRTPLAVISGAVSVIQQRGQLQPDDEKTLARIASASTDMSQYVNALLTLIRQKNSGPVEQIDLVAVYQELASSYAWQNPHWANRLALNSTATPIIWGNAAIAKIALHNLLYNALVHTENAVTVSIDDKRLSVCDQGALTIAETQGTTAEPFVQGLGLYIVDMACKHLQWHMSVQHTAQGRCSQLEFSGATF